MKHFLLLALMFVGLKSRAHDANKAYFNLSIEQNQIMVDAEFPWTIRNALLSYDPQLEFQSDQHTFNNRFKDYVTENFKIEDNSGEPLNLLQVEILQKDGHSHQVNYQFIFEKGLVKKISNSLMFNLQNNQINVHTITINGESIIFETKAETSTFEIEPSSNNLLLVYAAVGISSVLFLVIYKIFKRRQ